MATLESSENNIVILSGRLVMQFQIIYCFKSIFKTLDSSSNKSFDHARFCPLWQVFWYQKIKDEEDSRTIHGLTEVENYRWTGYWTGILVMGQYYIVKLTVLSQKGRFERVQLDGLNKWKWKVILYDSLGLKNSKMIDPEDRPSRS